MRSRVGLICFAVASVFAMLSLSFIPAVPAAPSLERGKAVYQKSCAACHGDKGNGKGPAAMALNPRPTNFRDPKVMAKFSTDDLIEAVTNGKPGRSMPKWRGTLSEEEIRSVVDYVERLYGRR